MKRNKTPKNVVKPFGKVFDAKGQRSRGLWLRDGVYYAQMNPSGQQKQYKYRLQGAETVPQAQTAMQVLKAKQRAGELLPPTIQQRPYAVQTGGGSTLHVAIVSYQTNRDKLGGFDARTCSRQDNSLAAWDARCGKLQLANLNNMVRADFTAWRRSKGGGKVCGRTIDNDISAMGHVIQHAIDDLKLLPATPFGLWKKLDRGPAKKIRLLEHSEVDDFTRKAFVTEFEMERQHWPEAYRKKIRHSNQAFSDYIYVLAYSGARERETTMLRWTYVDWDRKTILFPGANAKKGGGVPAEDRRVDFNSALESHLRAMYARRNTDSDYLFPNDDLTEHVKSFRKQLNRVKKCAKFADMGFHHFRHYFISYAVMSQPYIDIPTIAYWVGHRDHGVLIMRKYLKLRSAHTAAMGQQLNLCPVNKPALPPGYDI
jgi:integrase